MLIHIHILSALIGLPILGAMVILAVGRDEEPLLMRFIAVLTVLGTLYLCIPLYQHFDVQSGAMQFLEHGTWIPAYGIQYNLGIDGISFAMIVLTNFITLIVVLAACQSIKVHVAQYFAVFLLLQGMMVGAFAAMDAVLFYVFWEMTLVPMYLAIGIWGSENRHYASIKFFLYTFAGSAIMLVAIIYLGLKAGSFSIQDFYPLKLGNTAQIFLFIAFLLGFAVKIPMWPVHTWLPDAHTEAPAGGSVILAALMLKMGAYGLLRFSLPILPDASSAFSGFMIVLSLIAVVYIGLIAIVQQDMKRLIAYSSISHMGFVTLGCFMVYAIFKHTHQVEDAVMGVEGAVAQMISHGLSSAALFIAVGLLYDRMHTRQIADFGGVVRSMPVLSAFFMLFALTNAGLPGTSGFVGEFMIILVSFKASLWIAVLSATTLVLAASYTLWMYKRVFFGEAVHASVQALRDVTAIEWLVLGLLSLAIMAMGVYPRPIIDVVGPSVEQILHWGLQTKL